MQKSAARYLIFFQYAGTKYSGVMKTAADQAVEGVENHLEVSLCLTIQNNCCIFQKLSQIIFSDMTDRNMSAR
uniref:Uncharacterized protein n=1 Tax=Sinocyclocheilus rhinocerous TaxID=307959 RepID=A0A673LM51_9TELE